MKKIEFMIDEQLEKKFKSALILSEDIQDDLLKDWIEQYVQEVFNKELGIKLNIKKAENKLLNKIQKWAVNDNIPHKLIKSFLLNYDENANSAIKEEMIATFISFGGDEKKFINNYAQMKSNGTNAHGKIFFDDRKNIFIRT